MASVTTFNVNDVVFVESVGYGTLMSCGVFNTITIKDKGAGEKK
jgi:hypothetical protein